MSSPPKSSKQPLPQTAAPIAIGDGAMPAMNSDAPKHSRYIAAGLPQHCFLPSCRKLFQDRCRRSKDGRYYCSEVCAEIASKLDFSQVEAIKRMR